MYSVRVATMKEFRESRDAWDELALSMSFPSIFCTWEWIYTWWEHFGARYEPVIILVFKEKELAGILPLAARTTMQRADWLFGRILTYCGSQETAPDHLDIVAKKEEALPCLEAIEKFLSSDYRGWDVLQLSHASEGNNIVSWVKDEGRSFPAVVKQASVAPYIPLPKSIDEYMNQFNSKKKYNLKRDISILTEKRGAKYISSDFRNSSEAMRNLFSLHEQRAKRKNIESTFQGVSLTDFHNAFIKRAGDKGWIWLRSLEHEKRTIAALYGFSYRGRVFYYQIGHDTAWERFGPGKVLMYYAIREACERNYEEFDFLRGSEEYKSYWTKNRRLLLTANIYNRTLRGAISSALQKSKTTLKKVKNF